jgi:alpha-galactosidase
MPKITFIGAGSAVFVRRLLGDLLTCPELRDGDFWLMDVDPGRLAIIEPLARRMVETVGGAATINATRDRRAALDGADYVIVLIQVGGLAAYELDVEIPRRYGIDQCVGDTLGPGGVFRALRTIPVLLDICRDMEQLCPEALLMNYANPMAMNCWAMSLASRLKTVGLCHSVQSTARLLARFIGAPSDEVTYWVAGINHLAWFLRFEWKGRNAYPLIWEAMKHPDHYADGEEVEVYEGGRARFELMRHFGYFVTESSHHLSEYVPYFRRQPDLLAALIPRRWDYLDVCRYRWQAAYEQLRREGAGELPIVIERSPEYAADIIHALETNTPCRINANVPNTGLITNLPPGCCVEVPCLVDGTGLHPCFVGDLPPQCAALDRVNISVQELAVQAALTGDRRLATQAIMLDPLTASILTLDQITEMTEAMFAAESKYLSEMLAPGK